MSSNLLLYKAEYMNQKWIDSIKRDITFCGIGTANNQLHRRDGSKSEMHPPEDRSFAYVIKNNSIYAYGLLDGFHGSSVVDFVEQTLSNFCFDFSNDDLETKSDGQIFGLITEQFKNIEKMLEEHYSDILTERTMLSFKLAEPGLNRREYENAKQNIIRIDKVINCGSFGTLTLIVDKRLFVVNVGTSHWFLCSANAQGNLSTISLGIEHNLSNADEELRIKNLRGIINCKHLLEDDSVNYTRCLGDFKTKTYYNEINQFKYCVASPIISDPEHHFPAITVTNDCLFMVMYSDALGKAIEKTGLDPAYVDEKIAQMLLEKIKTEVSLNSAAQSVVDEIKRAHDECCKPGDFVIREDLTLIVRIFNENLRDILNDNLMTNCSMSSINSSYNTISDGCCTNNSLSITEMNNNAACFDANGNIKPYVDFDVYNKILETDIDTRNILEGFERELEELVNISDCTRL